MKIAKNSARKKNLTRIGAAILVIGLGTSATWFTLHAQSKSATEYKAPPKSALQPSEKLPVVVPGVPVRLKIPKINVDAAIEGMGVTAQGDMDSPDGPDNTGWYKLGPRPGEVGSAVIDGHFGWRENKPAVFDKLHTLAVGDLIMVEDDAEGTHTFAITKLRTYGPNDDATEVFKSADNVSHLNLITCQGVWNKDLKSYSTRLVVFADLKR